MYWPLTKYLLDVSLLDPKSRSVHVRILQFTVLYWQLLSHCVFQTLQAFSYWCKCEFVGSGAGGWAKVHRLVDNNISAQIGIVGPWPRVQLLQFLTKLPNFSSYRRQLHQSLNLFDNYILKKIIPFCKIFVYSYYTYFTWSVSRSLGRSFKLA